MTYTNHQRADAALAKHRNMSASLPSVEDWVKAGGVIQYPTHAPRQDKTMVAFNTRETK